MSSKAWWEKTQRTLTASELELVQSSRELQKAIAENNWTEVETLFPQIVYGDVKSPEYKDLLRRYRATVKQNAKFEAKLKSLR